MNLPFNYRHLHYFWVVVKEGGIARAAERLGMAVQTVSSQVGDLERSLGFTLLKSSGRRLELTEAGKEAFRHAEAIFQLGAELQGAVRQAATSATRKFAVGITDGLPKAAVLRLLEPISRMDSVHLQAWEYGFDDMLAALALHRLDLVLADRPAPHNANLKVFNHRLGAASIEWYAAPALHTGTALPFPHSLGELPLLLPTHDMALRTRIDQWLDAQKLRPRVVGEFADSGLMATFGAHGMGAFPATGWSRDDLTRGRGLVLLGASPDVLEQFYAISAERKIQNPLIQEILAQQFD
ncbi:LysR family transcriptional regulator [Ideonella sp. BN130291]|uniref:LysR family transcriptional regulator n=1 Tax=Ideonella sp. BN130291 TaxID=3112940 RepID=UPI002E26F4CF|nr:LysR family transcriptional regulator [Ideonella sp. BN130291]